MKTTRRSMVAISQEEEGGKDGHASETMKVAAPIEGSAFASEEAMLGLPPSYLDVLEQRLNPAPTDEDEGLNTGRRSISRLLLVARLGETAAAEAKNGDASYLTKKQEGMFKLVLAEENAAPITGVMIVQKDSMMHLIESSSDTCTGLLRLMVESEDMAGCIEDIKIVAASDDCPTTYFSRWYHYCLQLPAETGLDIDNEDPVEAAWGVQDKLAELAASMESGEKSTTSSSTIKRKFSHLVASNERVLGLSGCPAFMGVEEFLEFDRPITHHFASEAVHPCPTCVPFESWGEKVKHKEA
ncbi:unnamed protein product [Chrysoparadoxa australica]